jgi:hypothetical protein
MRGATYIGPQALTQGECFGPNTTSHLFDEAGLRLERCASSVGTIEQRNTRNLLLIVHALRKPGMAAAARPWSCFRTATLLEDETERCVDVNGIVDLEGQGLGAERVEGGVFDHESQVVAVSPAVSPVNGATAMMVTTAITATVRRS